MKKQGFILIGPSGSGKSTTIETLRISYGELAVFSLDTCRLTFYDVNYWTNEDQKETYRLAFEYAMANEKDFDDYINGQWEMTLKNNDVVVVDNTNLTRKSRARWANDLRKFGFEVTMIELFADLETVIDRQNTREDKSVPSAIVRQQYMRQESVHVGSEADHVITRITL